MKNLAYWKGRLIDAQRAFKATPTPEYLNCIKYATRKLQELERAVRMVRQ